MLDSDDWNFGNGDFTIDFRVRFDDLPSVGDIGATVYSQYESGAIRVYLMLWNNGGTYTWDFLAQDASNAIRILEATTVAADTWYHVAVVRSGNNFTLYQDGVKVGSTVVDTDSMPDVSGELHLGARNNDEFLKGWLDEYRVSKGIARWARDFTPETSAYSASALPLTSSRFWTFADWQSGRALINTDIGLYAYVGTGSASVVSGAPLGKFLVIWEKYAFIFGVRGSPSQGRYSAVSDYTTWGASNTLNFDTNDGDVITGVRILRGKLYVFKRYSIFRVTYLGSNPTFQVDQIYGRGCPSHYAIKEVDMGVDIGSVLVLQLLVN